MTQLDVLKEIGLSKTGIKCYGYLLEHGPATTRRLAESLKLPQSNLYGVLDKLAEQGFISRFKMTSRPTLFTARPLNYALREHYMHQRRILTPLCNELGVSPPPVPPPLPRARR